MTLTLTRTCIFFSSLAGSGGSEADVSGSSSDGGGSAVGVGLPQLVDQMSLGSPSSARAQAQTLSGSPGGAAGTGNAGSTGKKDSMGRHVLLLNMKPPIRSTHHGVDLTVTDESTQLGTAEQPCACFFLGPELALP